MNDVATSDASTQADVVQRGSLELTLRRLRRDKASMIALCVILAVVVLAIAAPWIAALTGHSPIEQFRDIGLSPAGIPVGPGEQFWLGTDQLGRDVLVRLAYGARISLLVGVFASVLASTIAVIVGTTAGYHGGLTDIVLSRLMDLVMSVPFLLCALALVSAFGPSLMLSVCVIVFFSWAPMARVIRGQVISLRKQDFVQASRSLGAGPLSIMIVDILPNLAAPIIVYTTMQIPSSIVFEATLSFLGMGIVPPTPSWGGMLADASSNSLYLVAWWLVFVPGTALLLTTLAFNILGDGLRDALDPKSARTVRRFRLKSKGASKR
ncbi:MULTISPECIES: ABC transporter permease [unclassified Rhizobium]|jgi:ABC-type dipeptide/oligopeptide/nickel transport system permease subunit|uniref:ABC transporter permease n=1 Tax=unclassified Rhizobium TaxID=2613769 RepID=UPI000646425C|nr:MULTISPECIES: ABC transporter permease [unclassified Rhizobium]MBN8954617.1 ABC transporter permease [Rhizobium tropici]OJY68034.1 MAG: ABC transporter permease [Rhizobium sp. 60-20]RKD40479.1 peptide/nickel transport system permease protein [Rhizobium sp. WW_1]